jgi:DNA invertase Pin-like site-specific DNA recombinase
MARCEALKGFGVTADRVYVNHGLTGTNRDRPGLRPAMAAYRHGDTLVVTELDWLAPLLPDACDTVKELTEHQVRLSLAGPIHNQTAPRRQAALQRAGDARRVASGLIRTRTREGMKVARAKGRLRSKKPKLSPSQEAYLVKPDHSDDHTSSQLAELFGVAGSTVYRVIERSSIAT